MGQGADDEARAALPASEQITRLLADWNGIDGDAAGSTDALFEAVYATLRDMAARRMSRGCAAAGVSCAAAGRRRRRASCLPCAAASSGTWSGRATRQGCRRKRRRG